jgi:ribonuclease HI
MENPKIKNVGLFWVPGHAGVRGNETGDKLARDGFVQKVCWI